MRRADVPAWRWCARALAAVACLAATAGWTSAAAPPPPGDLHVLPASVTQGVSYSFTLQFTTNVNFDGGSITLTVPPDWPTPVNAAAGAQDNVSCDPTVCAQLSTSGQNIIIQPAQNQTPTITVDYDAMVPATATGATFMATEQATRFGLSSTTSQTVTATPSPSVVATTPSSTVTDTVSVTPSTPISSATTTPAIQQSTTPASTPASASTKTPPPAGRDPVLSLPVALGVTGGFALVLFAGWRQHHRSPGGPGSSVRAVPRSGPPPRLSVRTTGREPTRTVRIEPHPGTTTIEETSRDDR
jgi:hypothetical protein